MGLAFQGRLQIDRIEPTQAHKDTPQKLTYV